MDMQVDPNTWLLDLKEGDMFESAPLMEGLDPSEPLVWKVLEVVKADMKKTGDGLARRITVHAYFHDVFVLAGSVMVDQLLAPLWRFK